MNNQESQGTTNQPDEGLGEMRCSSSCQHDWVEEYYGDRCSKCDLFYAHGTAPWCQSADDDFDDDDEHGPRCMSCGGEGIVDSVCEESGRWGWDNDGPGTCPNCNGSGLRKDQTYF